MAPHFLCIHHYFILNAPFWYLSQVTLRFQQNKNLYFIFKTWGKRIKKVIQVTVPAKKNT